jgi:Fe-S-cluster containining protein
VSGKTDRRAIAALDAIYAALPPVACRGLCGDACGPVPLLAVEAVRMRRADPRRRAPAVVDVEPGQTGHYRCVYLTSRGRCAVYDVRPFICRLWGAVKRLSCPHGCAPDPWLSDHAAAALFGRLTRIGGWQITTPAGVVDYADAEATVFSILSGADRMPPAVVDALAEKVRSLRALHGGRILAATPSATDRMTSIDDDSQPVTEEDI